MKKTFKYIIPFFAYLALFLGTEVSGLAQNLPERTYEEKDGVAYVKKAWQNEDGTYTIDLETFVTGKVMYTESADPSDIVLVLDVSGSMNEEISSGYVYTEATVSTITWRDYNGYPEYYFLYNNEYCRVREDRGWSYGNGYYYYLRFTYNYRTYYINSNGVVVQEAPTNITNQYANLLPSNVTLYTREWRSISKMDALKEAVNAFIGEVEKNAKFDKKGNERHPYLEHRISIVKFAGLGNSDPGYYGGENQFEPSGDDADRGNHRNRQGRNYTEVVRGLTYVLNGGVNNLQTVVNSLQAGGATAANGGMKLAKNIIDKIDRTSNKTVVFFTDGGPTYTSNEFGDGVANGTIVNAKAIKDITYGTGDDATHPIIFSVSVFDDEHWGTGDNYDKFMNYVSSNYPNPPVNPSMTNPGQRDQNADYYKDASGGNADLTAIFKAIAGAAASQNSPISSNSVVTVDVVAGSFAIPVGASANKAEVLVAPCTGITKIDGTDYLTFGEEKPASEFFYYNDNSHDYYSDDAHRLPDITLKVDPENNKVSTEGFDYSKNFCGPDEAASPLRYRGYKQIIRFIVEARDDAVGGPNVATNDGASGIYVNGEQIAEFNRPTVKVPVQIWIQKDGLDGDDSASFTLYFAKPGADFDYDNPENNTWTSFTKIIFNSKNWMDVTLEDGRTVKVVKQKGLDPDYVYKIKEDDWAFGYVHGDTWGASDGVAYSFEYKDSEGNIIAPANPFVFMNSRKEIIFDEAVVRNIFKGKTGEIGGGVENYKNENKENW